MESGKFGATSSIPPIKRENKEEKKKKYDLYIVEQKFLYKISYNRRKKKEREN